MEAMNGRRLLHVSTTINRGGAENHLFDLVQHQREVGAVVEVAYLRGQRRELGVPAHDLQLRFYGDVMPVLRLRRIIARFQPELVHAHLPPGELYARLALIGHSVPMLITKHNAEPFYRGVGEKLMGRWVARRATAVIVISNAVADYMRGPALGLRTDKLHTIHYGMDPRPFENASREAGAVVRQQWGVPPEALLVGFVGRLAPQKSVDTLLRGFALLRQRTEADVRLALVGSGRDEPILRQLASDLDIADRVVWPGFREDAPAVMRAFDIFALTSIYEGFGLALVEAMAAQLPVVATGASAMLEIVEDGKSGLLVRPREPGDVADALHRLCDRELRARLGAAGSRRVREEFTLERMFRATDELYATFLPS